MEEHKQVLPDSSQNVAYIKINKTDDSGTSCIVNGFQGKAPVHTHGLTQCLEYWMSTTDQHSTWLSGRGRGPF